MIFDSTGWLQGVKHIISPNFNQRPEVGDISLLVIHNISLPAGDFGNGYIEQLFCNTLDCSAHANFSDLQNMRVSAHFLLNREGDIIQFVSILKRAWHAGVSQFKGRENCNDFSIGIELEGTDHIPFSAEQYAALIQLSNSIIKTCPQINPGRVVGHSDIAPGRKTDPGPAFDWHRYFNGLAVR